MANTLPTIEEISHVRSLLLNALPDSHKKTSSMLINLEQLFLNNKGSDLEQAQLLYAFADKYISSIETFTIEELSSRRYIESCKFVAYVMMGTPLAQAYEYTFPMNVSKQLHRLEEKYGSMEDREQRKVSIDIDYEVYLHKASRQFNSIDMVTRITEISLVPAHLGYAHIFHQSINKLTELMTSSRSEKIQMESAIALVNKLDKPDVKGRGEDTKIEDVVSVLNAFKELSKEISGQQSKQLSAGTTSITDVIVLNNSTVKKGSNLDD